MLSRNGKGKTLKATDQFTHLVLTRFNVVTTFAAADRGIEEAWLKERVALFMKYCLPSIKDQKQVCFHWLVFCNADSPTWFKEHMASLSEFLTPVYIKGLATNDVFAREVKASGLVTCPYVITTRLDNDDALASNHLAMVQRAFKRQDRAFILFPLGLQLFRGHIYGLCWLDNPFFSLIEKASESGEIATVLCVRHGDIYKSGRVQRIWRTPQWLEVIHGNNVSNSLRGWPKFLSRFHSNFPSLPNEGERDDALATRVVFAFARVRRRLRRLFVSDLRLASPRA